MLLDLLTEDGFEPRRKCRDEYCCPCPACGGEDRFIVRTDNRERFFCRGCDISGDEIDYLRRFRGMTFEQAAALTGKQPSAKHKGGVDFKKLIVDKGGCTPPDGWIERAQEFQAVTHQILLEDAEMVERLRVERGLTRETIVRFDLGWLPQNLFDDRVAWGLPEELRQDGKTKKYFLPAGLIIPGPDRIRIRRDNPEEYGKYYVLPGSGNEPLIIDAALEAPALVVESELDGMLLAQELTTPVMIIAAGSTSNGPSVELKRRLSQRPFVLVSLDNDEAGAKSSWQRWIAYLPNAARAPLPGSWGAKDHTEAYLKGHDLNIWLRAARRLVECKPTGQQAETVLPQATDNLKIPFPCEACDCLVTNEKGPVCRFPLSGKETDGGQRLPEDLESCILKNAQDHKCPMQRGMLMSAEWCNRSQCVELCGDCASQVDPPRQISRYQFGSIGRGKPIIDAGIP
ncbi:primase-helicase zinc-binding domain-containing protein [Desulfosediminicola ganghwensis]|uniref:primase-helicase zinc-binding domain-containing protein n=1 Tax=Desulfosediminicola ganghwensis TaxID=2569540 RepID=UPI0010AC19C8|nr:primase-helicase zinc-binding domain-containing protein [Desulfosediminicola ganghwensis]